MTEDIRKIKECPDCGGINLIYKDAESQVICKDCGLIYEPLVEGSKNKK